MAVKRDAAFILPKFNQAWGKADGKLFYGNARSFGNDKMTQFMHKNQDTQNHDKRYQINRIQF
jgi:hypothetical protein